jgi:hypothetical protein
MVIPAKSSHTPELIYKLNQPQEDDDFRNILDSAVYWTQIDYNEETKKEVESLLVQDNI